MAKEYSKRKKDGATFTPKSLASFLATRMLSYYMPNKDSITINDPACGDGALLIALSSALREKHISFKVHGCDKNPEYVCQTITHLNKYVQAESIEIECKDFIEEKIGGLFSIGNLYDLIIANPPYVRTQILGAEYAQRISNLYNLNGRIDLYYPFLINMTESLKPGGIMGVITSNRYLTTKSGADIRTFLLKNYDILEIIDLGDTKLFDAAVLPAIFIGRKKCAGHQSNISPKFISIYEKSHINNEYHPIDTHSIYSALSQDDEGIFNIGGKKYEIKRGTLDCSNRGKESWSISTNDNNSIVSLMEGHAEKRIGDYFKVRVGIKSCADDVFFTQMFPENKPESVWFRKIISQENIERGRLKRPLKLVLYPHYDHNGKKDVYDIYQYPQALTFFLEHEEKLRSRKYLTKTNRKWYEYWVPQNPVLWKYPKIVWADISSEPRFAFDDSGAIVNGNCYWICVTSPDQIDLLYLVMGVANSEIVEQYHDIKFNNKLYNGKRRYLAQYVEQYPLPNINSTNSKEVIRLTKLLVQNADENNSDELKSKIEFAVRRAFGFMD